MSKLISGILIAVFSMGVVAQTKLPPGWQSTLVKVTSDGKLVYYPDKQGNTIPDFSRVGYHHGDISIPHYPITKIVYPIENGDNRQHIQNAIDEISRMEPDKTGHRGTILLKRGVYHIYGSIRITVSGIILMG